MANLRFAIRRLAGNPAFTLLAAALLAVGIGANAVIFGALDAILFRPLPAHHPEQLVHVVQEFPRLGRRSGFGYNYYRALLQHSTTLSTAFGEVEMEAAMADPAPAEEVRVHLVTPEFFDALNGVALVGRALTVADSVYTPGAPPAVLSYGFWQRRFGGDARAVGRTIQLHGHGFPIVGVMPREFNGISIDTTPDVRVPLRSFGLLDPYGRNPSVEHVAVELAARLQPGVSIARAQAECLALWQSVEEGWKDEPPLQLDPMEHGLSLLRPRFSGALRLLIASVALLQLMVCANLAGLLLARGAQRRGELAIRLALGATRTRLVGQMLLESSLLTAFGAVGGVALAYLAAPLLLGALPSIRDLGTTRLALSIDFQPNGRVLLFSLAISALTALLFGIFPAVAAARVNIEGVLRGARAASGWRGRQLLLVAQIALCTLLLAGAGLLFRTFRQLRDMDIGFDTAQVVTFTANPSLAGYSAEQAKGLRSALTERVRQIPGVESVAAGARAVMRGSGVKTTIARVGEPTTKADFLNASRNEVSPDYFATMGTPILAGRALTEADASHKPVPVVVNQSFAERFFPGHALGGLFGNAATVAAADFEIVGVSKDACYRSLREPPPPTIFLPLTGGDFVLCVRARHPEAMIQPVEHAMASLAPGLPFAEVHTLAEEVDDSAAPERLTAMLASIFGVFAALLAAVGLYGLLALAVAERQREIAIRMALGARPWSIAGLFGGQALALVAAGVALGLGAAVAMAPLASALFYGVRPRDPASLLAAAVPVALVSACAALAPSMRAVRVDPAVALRE